MPRGPIQWLPRLGVVVLTGLLALAPASGAQPGLAPQLSEAESEAAVRAGVAAVMAAFVPPPGSVETASEPAGDGGLLSPPVRTGLLPRALRPNRFTAVRWWTLAGTPAQALGYVQAHPPAGSTPTFSGVARAVGFGWPSVPRARGTLELEVRAAQLMDGSTGLEVQVEGSWLTPRPPTEVLPGNARLLRVTFSPGRERGQERRVTTTNRRRIERVAELLNALPARQPTGPQHCPREDGESLRLAFYGPHGRSPLAVVIDELSGCGGWSVTIGGHEEPELEPEENLIRLLSQALRVNLVA